MNTKSGQIVTAGSGVQQLIVEDKPGQASTLTYYIKVLTGTVKFGIGSVGATAYGVTSADGVWIMECGREQLFYEAASGTDTFVVV